MERGENGSTRLSLRNSKIRELKFADLERVLSAPKNMDKNNEVKYFRRLGKVSGGKKAPPDLMELHNTTHKLGIHDHSTLRFWDDSTALQEIEEFEYQK